MNHGKTIKSNDINNKKRLDSFQKEIDKHKTVERSKSDNQEAMKIKKVELDQKILSYFNDSASIFQA